MILTTLAGLSAGTLHVVSGPDHLAAVAPLAVHEKNRPWLIGFRWGLGHASGVILVGLLSILLRGIIPVDLISGWAERLVGVVLIGIGLWGFKRAFSQNVHHHTHTHDGIIHSHFHVHKQPHHDDEQTHRKNHNHTHTAFAIGTLHGFAGSSHFLGVLPALAFPTTSEAALYLGAYGFGTILSMTLFSMVIGTIGRKTTIGCKIAYRNFMCVLSTVAIGVGVVWLFK